MAEKQLAYRAGGKDEFFADDDPLAELARIVGFDQRPISPAAANQRQEPAFDLEDELLREFERYDAPRATPAAQPAPEVAASAPIYPEPVNGNDLPDEPLDATEPHFAYEQPQAYEQHVAQAEVRPYVESDARWDPAEESWDSVSEPTTMPIDATPIEAPVAAGTFGGGARDLIDELEMSIGNAPAVEPAASKTQQWAAATIRLPLANFNAARREPPAMAAPAVEPLFDHPVPTPALAPTTALAPVADFEPPATLAYPAELDRHEFTSIETPIVEPEAPLFDATDSGFDLVAAARDGDVHADAALTEPAYAPAAAYPGLDIDDLLADVSRYPVPSRQQSAARFEPPFVAPAAAQTAPAVAELLAAPVPDVAPFVEAETAEPVDSFDDHDFDLDLADIELELAELDLADSRSPSAVAAPSHSANVPADDWSQPAPISASSIAPAAVAAFAAVPLAAAPLARVAEPVVVREPEPVFDTEQLPFDPNEISDTEDRVESFEGIHVPALPPAEPDEPVVTTRDYDFDIDAEMASLFSAPVETAAETAKISSVSESVPASGFAAAASVHGVTMQQKSPEGLDEFERALEEDFRRSFRETSERPDNVSQVMFESTHAANDRWRARSMRGMAVAAAAVVLLSGSAYGMYRWMAHNGSPLSFASGEPRVITADKDPIKVVPTDPGGKVVPNQDKAVYDRVAGAANQPPKQKELVTSDEQPVDVVQKTLIPENSLPDDSDGNADGDNADGNQATPVGETEDPRLLPGQGNATATNGQQANPAIAPRRVRTMIVKPDGSLVAREEAPPADDKAATPVAAASPTKPTAATTQVASADDSDAPNADSAPIRMVRTTQVANTPVVAPATTPPPATTATSPASPPVTVPAASSPIASDTAPIPTARPTPPAAAPPAATQTAAKPPVAPKPVQVAATSPAPQPVKAAPTPSTSAGGYVMQIASLPSEEEAKRSQANLTAKFAGVLGGHPVEVRKVDIAGKGTYYRVRVAAGSKDDAAALCVKFRAAGGTCLISK